MTCCRFLCSAALSRSPSCPVQITAFTPLSADLTAWLLPAQSNVHARDCLWPCWHLQLQISAHRDC